MVTGLLNVPYKSFIHTPQRRQILHQWRQCDKSRCSPEHYVLFLSASQNPSLFGTFSTQRHIAESLVYALRKCLSQFTCPLESGKVSVSTRVHLLRGSLWCKRFMSWLFFIWFSRKKAWLLVFNIGTSVGKRPCEETQTPSRATRPETVAEVIKALFFHFLRPYS